MNCADESASHYAGCDCNEEHWRSQLATAVAAREKAERERDAQTEIARTVLRTAEELGAKLAEAQREKASVFSVTAIGHDGCGKDHADHLPEFNVCWICKWEAAEAERDQLRERLDKEEEERGRQFGLRVQAETEVERLMSLVQAWYEGRARIGAHMTFADQRFYDGVRCQRTGWPGDDASGDGGPQEES